MAAFYVDTCEQHEANETTLLGHARLKTQDNWESAGRSIVAEASQVIDDAFAKTVVEYWDNRSDTYSNCVLDEIDTAEYAAWKNVLTGCLEGTSAGECTFISQKSSVCERMIADETVAGAGARSGLRVLDLGCGPGFFEILLSQMGCAIMGVDSSEAMIQRASANVAAYGNQGNVAFCQGDISDLPFDDNQFDLVISRNVTWLMRNPQETYAEWKRVLKSGGKLLVFDANWYRYLADEATNEQRKVQQQQAGGACYEEDARATKSQENECEAIARNLPLTYELRPAWDMQALSLMGYSKVSVDQEVWKKVWTSEEQAFYASSPLFMIEATK